MKIARKFQEHKNNFRACSILGKLIATPSIGSRARPSDSFRGDAEIYL